MKFVQACLRFFGRKEGQTLAQFGEEVRQLTPADRAELTPMLAEALKEPIEETTP